MDLVPRHRLHRFCRRFAEQFTLMVIQKLQSIESWEVGTIFQAGSSNVNYGIIIMNYGMIISWLNKIGGSDSTLRLFPFLDIISGFLTFLADAIPDWVQQPIRPYSVVEPKLTQTNHFFFQNSI